MSSALRGCAGARLTAFELVHDGLPATLLCDSAAATLMAQGKVDAVVVGADRVVANGDTANKIGTYSHAVSAEKHGLPFFIAAPTTTLDANLATGADIEIEQRPAEEITHFKGQRVVVEGIGVSRLAGLHRWCWEDSRVDNLRPNGRWLQLPFQALTVCARVVFPVCRCGTHALT